MATTRRSTSFLLLLLASLFLLSSSSSTDSFLLGGCTQQKYAPDSPYEFNLNSLLTSLVNSATYSSFNNFTILGSSPQDVVYGLYQCRGDLSMPDCAACVTRAVSQVDGLCPQTCGGALQLEGCYVKYDNVTFLGVEDKSVVLKKCGPSVGYEPETMSRRDAVLAGLASAAGPYRVGGTGEVQGVAQCVGDLTLGQCQDCVSEAIGRLRNDCGMADYGDMFLGKCYARYSTGKAPSDVEAPFEFEASVEKSCNKEEKTRFAITIGVLAGVALLTISVTFIRKMPEDKPIITDVPVGEQPIKDVHVDEQSIKDVPEDKQTPKLYVDVQLPQMLPKLIRPDAQKEEICNCNPCK